MSSEKQLSRKTPMIAEQKQLPANKRLFSRQYSQIHLTGMLIKTDYIRICIGVGGSRLKWYNYDTVPTSNVLNYN